MDEGPTDAGPGEVVPPAGASTPDDHLPWYWVFDGRELHPFAAPTFVLPATDTFRLGMSNGPAATPAKDPDPGDSPPSPVEPVVRNAETEDTATDDGRRCRDRTGRRTSGAATGAFPTRATDGRRTALCLLSGVMAVCAVIGALGLAVGLVEADARIPFHGSPVGALLLALIVAVPMSWTSVSAARRNPLAPMLALTSGLLLVGWIAAQWVLVRTAGSLQPVYAMAGCAVAALGIALGRPRRAERPR